MPGDPRRDSQTDGEDGDPEHRIDTVPPPATGDAYSAETAVRQASPDLLRAIRRASELSKQASSSKPPSNEFKLPALPSAVEAGRRAEALRLREKFGVDDPGDPQSSPSPSGERLSSAPVREEARAPEPTEASLLRQESAEQAKPLARFNESDVDESDVDDEARTRVRAGPRVPIRASSPHIDMPGMEVDTLPPPQPDLAVGAETTGEGRRISKLVPLLLVLMFVALVVAGFFVFGADKP